MKSIAIHVFMHVPYEGLGCIEQWIKENNHTLTFTKFYENQRLPKINDIDWLIVMGGPMSVSDEFGYPWLSEEKIFLRNAIDLGKTVLGICLGSQLIAKVLGSKVYANTQKEIGWFELQLTKEAKERSFLHDFENTFPVFHWHGDTFDLPPESINLFRSEVTKNQGFLYLQKVLGLQFHLEVTSKTLDEMLENGKNELIENKTIQSADTIRKQNSQIDSNNRKMFEILDYLQNN